MSQEERLKAILEYLQQFGKIHVEEICERFQVSRDTARRDLVKLEENRLITRIHGGAMLPTYSQRIPRYEERLEHTDKKRSIGHLAASLIQDGEHLFMDTSTTIHYAAEALTARDLVVVTNSIDTASTLGKKDFIKIHLLGGEYNPWHRNVTGVQAIESLRQYRVQTLFIGACGMSAEGLSSPLVDEAYLKKEMIKRARRIVVLADHSKFTKSFLHHVCGLDAIDILITDTEPPAYMQEALQQHNIQIITVNGGEAHDN